MVGFRDEGWFVIKDGKTDGSREGSNEVNCVEGVKLGVSLKSSEGALLSVGEVVIE